MGALIMPVKRRLQRTLPDSAGELTRLLHNEWTKPKRSGQPLIVIEGNKNQPIHIYVIWDRWGDLSQTERSEMIMDVIDHLSGKDRLPANSPVTVAMGLTTEEAKRMGIKVT